MLSEFTRATYRGCCYRNATVRKQPFHGSSFYVETISGKFLVFDFANGYPTLKVFQTRARKWCPSYCRQVKKTVVSDITDLSKTELDTCIERSDPRACVTLESYTAMQFKAKYPHVPDSSRCKTLCVFAVVFNGVEYFFDANSGQQPRFRQAFGYSTGQRWLNVSFAIKEKPEDAASVPDTPVEDVPVEDTTESPASMAPFTIPDLPPLTIEGMSFLCTEEFSNFY